MEYNRIDLDFSFEKGGELDFNAPPISDQAVRAVS